MFEFFKKKENYAEKDLYDLLIVLLQGTCQKESYFFGIYADLFHRIFLNICEVVEKKSTAERYQSNCYKTFFHIKPIIDEIYYHKYFQKSFYLSHSQLPRHSTQGLLGASLKNAIEELCNNTAKTGEKNNFSVYTLRLSRDELNIGFNSRSVAVFFRDYMLNFYKIPVDLPFWSATVTVRNRTIRNTRVDRYDILLLTTEKSSLNDLGVISARHADIPVLIQQKNKIYLYGFKNNRWQLTELNKKFFKKIQFPEENKILLLKAGNLTKKMYHEIFVKRAHTHHPKYDVKRIVEEICKNSLDMLLESKNSKNILRY